MKKKSQRIAKIAIASFTASFILVLAVAPTVYALTWSRMNLDFGAFTGTSGDIMYQVLDADMHDGKMHIVALKQKFTGGGIDKEAISYGSYSGTDITWTDIVTTTDATWIAMAGEPTSDAPGALLKLDDNTTPQNPGILVSFQGSGTATSTLQYHDKSLLGNWTSHKDITSAEPSSINTGAALGYWGDGSSSYPYIFLSEDTNGGDQGWHEYMWSATASDFEHLGRTIPVTGLPATEGNTGAISEKSFVFTWEETTSGKVGVWNSRYSHTASAWDDPVAIIRSMDASDEPPILALIGENDASSMRFSIPETTNTSTQDKIRFGKYESGSWSSGTITSGIELEGDVYMRHGVVLHSSSTYVMYHTVDNGVNVYMAQSDDGGDSWTPELIVGSSDAVGARSAAMFSDTSNSSLIALTGFTDNATYITDDAWSGALPVNTPEFSTWVYLLTIGVTFTMMGYVFKRQENYVTI